MGSDLVLHHREYVNYRDEFQPHAQFGRVLSGLCHLTTSGKIGCPWKEQRRWMYILTLSAQINICLFHVRSMTF